MKKYEKPIVMINEDLAEGVYAAPSGYPGEDCYDVEAVIVQEPALGQDCFVIQCDADHVTSHHSTGQYLVITFNQPVRYSKSGGSLVRGDNTETLEITYAYHNNAEELGIGLGDLYVYSDAGLAVVSAILYCNMTCDHN